jgi:polar amino acid transport system permease protein
MGFFWNWDFTWQILPQLLLATVNTLIAAAIGYCIAVILGLVFALLQRTPFPAVNRAIRETVEFVRSTPLVLQVFFVFYVGPQIGIRMSPWMAGMLAIGVHYSSYLSEVYRGGIDAVPKGQWDATVAMNLSTRDTYFRIIIPQALPLVMAGMGNYLVAILKDTPILSVIGVPELMQAANSVGSENYRYLEPITIVGVIFLVLSLPLAAVMRLLEARIRRKLGIS